MDTIPTGTCTHVRTIDAGSSTDLVAACKEQKIGVTAALHAALVTVTYARAEPGTSTRHYSSPTPVSLRKFLPTQVDGDDQLVSLLISGVQITLPPKLPFLEQARSFQKWYETSKSPEWLIDAPERAVRFGSLLELTRPKEWGLPSQPQLNSLGVIDRFVRSQHTDVQVEGARVGVEVLTPENVFYVWTFRGKLHISVSYNQAFYTRYDMDEVLGDVLGVLARELDMRLF